MTLYISDLDGTLLNRNHRIPASAAEILNRLMAQGMLFTFATARSWHSAHVVTKGLSPKLPWIVHNGAFIADGASGFRHDEIFFTETQRAEILNLCNKLNLWPLCYSVFGGEEKVFYLDNVKRHPGMDFYIASRQGDRRLTPVQDSEALLQGDAYYFTFIHEKSVLMPLYEQVKGSPWLNLTFQQELYREEFWLEITPKEATKAQAALRLKEHLGCDKLVAFGDSMNDLPLFQVADESYAVENALPQVKAAASSVIESNEKGGVAKFLLDHYKRVEDTL